ISQNTVLCGDLYYTGAFAIQGGATVTCPSGSLSIHAPSISIDPSSAIDLSATSSTLTGGGSGDDTGLGIFRASAGGSGTQGGTGPCYGFSCPNTFTLPGGPVFGSFYDTLVSQGSAGGNALQEGNVFGTCTPTAPWPGGKGGGSVQLFASAQISLLGDILV